uniref:Uncharacterized protein LOC114341021 n=1 Tax=Diabrotica virgifera virgifera TaxID=50390 RepID=A0A6P7GNN0_DIAVI
MAETSDIDEVEGDPFGDKNMTAFNEQMEETYDILHYMSYLTDSIAFLICILSIVADICIITIIMKTPKLKTKTSIYILHYSIWHILFMTGFLLVNLRQLFDTFSMVLYLVLHLTTISLMLILLLGLCLALDWFLNTHSPHFVKSSALFNKYAIYSLYILASVIHTVVYFAEVFIINGLYYFVAVSLSVFNFLDYRSKKNEINLKNNYGLVPSNIIIYFWLPIIVHPVLLNRTYGSFTLHSIVLYTQFLSGWFSLSASLALIIALIKMDVNIEVAILKIFNRIKMRCKDDVETLEEAENEDVPNSVAIDNNSVYIL